MNSRQAANDIYIALASSKEFTGLSLAVQENIKFSPTMSLVIGSVNRMPNSLEEVQETFAALTDNRAMAIARTISVHEHTSPTLSYVIRFLAMPTAESKPYSEEVVKDMALASANIYIEGGSKIWKVVGEGDNKRLVQSSEDDLDEILNSRKRYLNIASEVIETIPVSMHDFISFASTEDGHVMFGSIIGATDEHLLVAPYKQATVAKISPYQVLVAVPAEEVDKQYEILPDFQKQGEKLSLANVTEEDTTKNLDYYRKLWGDKAMFFEKLTQLLREHEGEVQRVWNSPVMNNTIMQHMKG